jgi:hypothetical protein
VAARKQIGRILKNTLILRAMKFLRSTVLSKFVAVATAVVFLNMSFFLSEITMLNLHHDNVEVLERLVKILANAGQEEEGDTESAEENTEAFVDLSIESVSVYHGAQALVQEHSIWFSNIILSQNVSEIATPPPRFS